MSWQNLEELMTELLMLDKATTIPGSGNGKGEEDVIGLSTITQCKYSTNKNMSILRKDMDRLKDAADLQKKIPLFVTEHDSELLLTIPESPVFKDILHYIIGMSLIRFVQNNITTNMEPELKHKYINLLYKRAIPILEALNGKYRDLAADLKVQLQDPMRELQCMMDMEETNGIKE